MKAETKITILFVIRICLWIIALVTTGYWMYYSFKLTHDGIFDPYEYAELLRPILYPCLVIAITAVCISFALYAKSQKLKKEMKESRPQGEEEDR